MLAVTEGSVWTRPEVGVSGSLVGDLEVEAEVGADRVVAGLDRAGEGGERLPHRLEVAGGAALRAEPPLLGLDADPAASSIATIVAQGRQLVGRIRNTGAKRWPW